MATTKKLLNYFEAVGRRKTSVARVRVFAKGTAGTTVNDKPSYEYFPTKEMQEIIKEPLKTVKAEGLQITVKVKGGGIHSQAEAVRHGVARALTKMDETLRTPLKKAKMLTRDARMKERRKFGLKKARKAPQWSKR